MMVHHLELDHLLSVIGFCLIVYCSVLVMRWKTFTSRVNKIPTPLCRSMIWGNLDIFLAGIRSGSQELNESFFQALVALSYSNGSFYKDGVMNVWLGLSQPLALLFRAETVEPLLINNTLIEKGMQYNFVTQWLGQGLLTSKGNKWKKQRKLLTPSFHFKILESFIPVMNEQTKTFCDLLEKESKADNGIIVNIERNITLCALDIICETAMGLKIDAQLSPDSEYVTANHRAAEVAIYRVTRPWLHNDFIFSLTSRGKMQAKDLHLLHSFTKKVVKERRENIQTDISRNHKTAFLDTLLLQQLKDPQSLSETDIHDEVNTFVFEGHDTTTTALSFAIYLVGLYPEVQERVHQEISSIFGDDKERPLSMDDLRDMKYIECVLKESLRLFPSVPVFLRTITEDFTITRDHTLVKGMSAAIAPYMVHRDPNHWPDTEKFDPDRFLPENSRNRHPFAFIPFSAGPRNCIGQKFALLEEKALFCVLFRKFRVTSLIPRDKMRITMTVVTKSVTPFRVKLEVL